MLLRGFRAFHADEAGAVTVDWVVLASAIAGLGLASAAAVRTGTSALDTDIQTSLGAARVASLGTLGAAGEAARFDPTDCAAGLDGVRDYADRMFAAGSWPSGTFDYDYSDVDGIIADYESYDDATAAMLRGAWLNDYATRPEAFDSVSNMVELAAAVCVAQSRGL